MQDFKMTYKFEVDEFITAFLESNKVNQDKFMIGFIAGNMHPGDAFDALFAAFGAVCDANDINKGKKLFEWSEKFDEIEKEFEEGEL